MILAAAGTILACLYFLIDLRFQFPVLALVSSYMETRFLAVFKTNFADETILILLLTGFSLWTFSREKKETADMARVRAMAVKKTIYLNIALLFFAVLFLYGGAFMGFLMMEMVLPFIIYLIMFHLTLKKQRRATKPGPLQGTEP